MNFGIKVSNNGKGEMIWAKPTDISTNVWWTMNIDKGSMFNNPNFGLDISDIRKITTNALRVFKQRSEDALKWLLTVGKASSIAVTVEKDDLDLNRINWQIDITQADGIPITMSSFRTIGGPSNGFAL
jgi:phage gp46-like protein